MPAWTSRAQSQRRRGVSVSTQAARRSRESASYRLALGSAGRTVPAAPGDGMTRHPQNGKGNQDIRMTSRMPRGSHGQDGSRKNPGLSADAVTSYLRKFVRLASCGRRLDLVSCGFTTRSHRRSVRNVVLKPLCKVGSVVGVDLRVVASTRHRHIRKPAIHKFLARLLRVHVHEHAVGGLLLAAVARHGVAVVKMRILFYVECDSAA